MCYGPEFIANAVQQWLAKIGVKTLYITPGSPWENGYCESFNGSMRDELLNGEIFYTLAEAKILIEAVRRQNIWRSARHKLAECGPRLEVDVRRRACGVASADIRWSVA